MSINKLVVVNYCHSLEIEYPETKEKVVNFHVSNLIINNTRYVRWGASLQFTSEFLDQYTQEILLKPNYNLNLNIDNIYKTSTRTILSIFYFLE